MGLFKGKNKDKSGVNTALLNKEHPIQDIVSTNINPDMDNFDLTFEDDTNTSDTYVQETEPVLENESSLDSSEELIESVDNKLSLNKEPDNIDDITIDHFQSSVSLNKEPESTISENYNNNAKSSEIDYSSLDKFDDNYRSKELKNYILYIITDKTFPGMLSYFRNYGSKVNKIFSSLADAKDELLMQLEPCKIVVIDSGTGKFTSMSARKSLMDLLSISDDENRIAIFYTDSVIKSEARNTEGVEDKDITWHPFKSNAEVLAVLLQNLSKENYIYDIKKEEKFDDGADLLDFYGATPKKLFESDLGLPVLTLREVFEHEGANLSAEDSLPMYKVKV